MTIHIMDAVTDDSRKTVWDSTLWFHITQAALVLFSFGLLSGILYVLTTMKTTP